MSMSTWSLCIQIGSEMPYDIDLTQLLAGTEDGRLSLGRTAPDGSSPWHISIDSNLITGSHAHGTFQWHQEGSFWSYTDENSTNGTYINEVHFRQGGQPGQQKPRPVRLDDGDKLRIDLPVGTAHSAGVHLILKKGQPGQYQRHDLPDNSTTTIGRKGSIVLSSINAENIQATITRSGDRCVLNFASRHSGFVNGNAVAGDYTLVDRDSLYMAGTLFQYAGNCLYQRSEAVSLGGVMLRVRNLTRKSRGKLDHVSFDIHKGELIGVIGSSGAGKSTLLNAISGNAAPDAGSVLYNGLDLIRHRSILKNSIGFVPQKDIMHEKLTVESMLNSAAKLRLRDNVGADDRKARVTDVIDQLGLTQQRKTSLTRVSGGQKKRASIGIEMLSDPDLFFLDEPTSGLDPGTEKNLMITLRQLAQQGKSVVLITHSTLALPMCDKIIIVGRDGKMTYFGEPEGALTFFQVSQYGDIFDKITQAEDADQWKTAFNLTRRDIDVSDADVPPAPAQTHKQEKEKAVRFSPVRQLGTLTLRYFQLILRNPIWLLCMLLVIPLAAAGIMSLMSNENTLVLYTDTYKVEFTLICIAAFAGLMTSYNEICKEREVFEREASANLHISSYLLSKVSVLSCISLFQSITMTAGFYMCVGSPGTSQFLPGWMEIGFSVFLTILAASCMGLLVSAVFKTGESATQPLIIVLIMQVVFSGAIMPLSGATRTLANFIFAFWGTNAIAASSGLSTLPMETITVQGMPYTPAIPDYDYLNATVGNLLGSWGCLILISVVCVALAFAALKWRKQIEALQRVFRR